MADENVQTQSQSATAAPPKSGIKRLLPGQTVCNEKDAKGNLCSAHLKQVMFGSNAIKESIVAGNAVFRCQRCGTLYEGPPPGHLRPAKDKDRFNL